MLATLPATWSGPVRGVARHSSEDARPRAAGEWIHDMVRQGLFGGRIEDRGHAIAVHRAQNAAVQRAIPAQRLLLLEGRHAWQPLCEFPGCAVPGEPQPVVNTGEDFLAGRGARGGKA